MCAFDHSLPRSEANTSVAPNFQKSYEAFAASTMGNSQSFDDDTMYGKDSIFAETEESSMFAHEFGRNDSKADKTLTSRKPPIRSSSPMIQEARQNRSQSYSRTNDHEQRDHDGGKESDSFPDDLSDRDELSAMTDMAWKHLSNQIKPTLSAEEIIDADKEFSRRRSRDDDDELITGPSFTARSPTRSASSKGRAFNENALGPSKKAHQSGRFSTMSDQDKYSAHVRSAKEISPRSFTCTQKCMIKPSVSTDSLSEFDGMWGNGSPLSIESDLDPVSPPLSPVSPASPQRKEDISLVASRIQPITCRLEASPRSPKPVDAKSPKCVSRTLQNEKILDREALQRSVELSSQLRQSRDEWNMDSIHARLDEISKPQSVKNASMSIVQRDIDDPTLSLKAETIQDTTIHDDEIKVENDSIIEVQHIKKNATSTFKSEAVDMYSSPSQAQSINMNTTITYGDTTTKNIDHTLTEEVNAVDRKTSNDTHYNGALVLDTSFHSKRNAHKPNNDKNIRSKTGDGSSELDNASFMNFDDVVSSKKAATSASAYHLMVHRTNSADLITEDFIDKCGDFVSNFVKNPLTSPCNHGAAHVNDDNTIVDTGDSDKTRIPAIHTAADIFPEEAPPTNTTTEPEVRPESISAKEELSEQQAISPVESSDLHSLLSDDFDVGFVQKYAGLFEAFLMENMELMDQNPDMISYLYVSKLTKIMEASEKLEFDVKNSIEKLRKEKESVLSLYRVDLLEAAKEKVVKGIQHEQELKILQEAGQVLEGKLKWKLLMKNANRARHESMLLQSLRKTAMDADKPLESLPANADLQVIRNAAAVHPTEGRDTSDDELLKELRQIQMENTFLNAEVSVLESKLSHHKHTANTHLWVDSVFRRLGTKNKEK